MLFSGIFLLMGSASYYEISCFQNDILEKEITGKLQNLAASHLDKLDRTLAERLDDVEVLSIDPVIASRKSTPAEMQKKIEKFLNRYPQYAAASFFDWNRIKIASAGQGVMDTGAQHPLNEYWPAVYEGKNRIVDVSLSSSLKVPTIHLVNPVKDDQGVTFGVLVVRTPVAGLFEMVGGAEDIDSNTSKYMVDILDKKGLVLYSNHNKSALLKETDGDFELIKSNLPPGKSMGSLAHQHEQNNGTGHQEGGRQILVFAKEQGYQKFKGNDWVLKIELPANHAFASINTLEMKMVVFLVVITLLAIAAILVTFLFTIARPLNKLNEATVRLGKGELDTRAAVASGDEIGKLAESFNKMSAHLKERVTQARSLSESLAATLNELNTIIEANPDILYVFNVQGKLVKWNTNFERFCGLGREQMMNRPATEFVCAEDRPMVTKAITEVFEKGYSFLEARLLRHDGALVPFLCNGVVLKDSNGEMLGLTGTGKDITERKQLEKQLSDALELNQKTISSSQIGILTYSVKSGQCALANEAAAKIVGATVGQLTQQNFRYITSWKDSGLLHMAEEVIKNGLEQRRETRMLSTFGKESWLHVTMTSFVSHGEQYLLVMLEDITERVKTQDALQTAKIQAEAASRAKSDFLVNMSHEIRTPMNSILGMSQLALKAETDHRQRDYLKKIHLSGEHLLGIIDDILDFSKIDAGKLTLETLYFDLDEVRQTLANLVTWRVAEKGLKLTFDFDPNIPHHLRGDPLRLNQILINYINNAIKFTEQGEIIVRAKRLEESAGNVLLRFEVQDTGIGITEEQKTRLFQTFQQADASTSRKYGGSGLGLVISKRLAALMGGEVGVESQVGKGSIFWLSLPIDKGGTPELLLPQDGGEEQEQADRRPAAMATLNGARILLAEDNLFNQQVAREFLEDGGATVCVAQNGQEALDLLRNEPFDCVLMDMQMLGMDGLEATRLIRADPALAGTRIIAMTANASSDDRGRCLAAGMDDFIGKPFKLNNFYATLAKWLPLVSIPHSPGRIAECLPLVQPQQESPFVARPSAVAETTKADDPNIIDLATLAELIGNDTNKIRSFALKFVESAREDIARIEEAMERNDMAAVGALGHRAKSPARMVGAMEFANLCQALENGADGGGAERARDIVSQLRLLLERIMEEMEKHLK